MLLLLLSLCGCAGNGRNAAETLDGAVLGTIDSLRHENGGPITLELEAPGGHEVIVFRSAQR